MSYRVTISLSPKKVYTRKALFSSQEAMSYWINRMNQIYGGIGTHAQAIN